ncbi:MAG TPA: hypothetical protein VFC19_37400, partial [Candidatus Limnocylindrales bacterium]|nr:hypothetical protein [Candidatus Limnocylindrales bacterium]
QDVVTVNLAREQVHRSADEVRSRMAAFQSGLQKGRAHADAAKEQTQQEGSSLSGTDDDATRDRLAP